MVKFYGLFFIYILPDKHWVYEIHLLKEITYVVVCNFYFK